jgi:CheY-like chemotaxis protein
MPKILLVETFALLRQDLAEVLRLEGYTVCEAEQGHAALHFAQAQRPDLILTAVRMPEMTGYELYRCLRELPVTAAIPVIFVTTGTLPPPAGVVLTPDNFLRKPFGITALLTLIRQRLDASAAAP